MAEQSKKLPRQLLDLVQDNSQSKFDPPPKGCEVYIGKIPSEIAEDELLALFSRVGKIYKMRLKMHFSGTNRGYAFVTFTSKLEAFRAVKDLNAYEIRPGKNIIVEKSVDNCRLFIGDILRSKTKEEVYEELSTKVFGIVEVHLYIDCYNRKFNRGFAIVVFSSHHAAAMAMRALVPECATLWNQKVRVDWADPETDLDEEQMRRVNVLYVRNLLLETSSAFIQSIFERAISKKIQRVKKIKDYAFIYFYKREDAELAIKTLQNTEIDGSNIEIQWAKPVDRELYRIQRQNKGNEKLDNGYDLFQILLHYKQYLDKEYASAAKAVEGIGSAGSPYGSPTIKPRGHMLPSSDGKHPYTLAPVKLDLMCKRYMWAQPVYDYQMYIDRRGIEIWVSRVELPQVGLPLLRIPRRVGPLMTGHCYSMQQANIESAENALRALQMLGSDLVQQSSPPPVQPLYPLYHRASHARLPRSPIQL